MHLLLRVQYASPADIIRSNYWDQLHGCRPLFGLLYILEHSVFRISVPIGRVKSIADKNVHSHDIVSTFALAGKGAERSLILTG